MKRIILLIMITFVTSIMISCEIEDNKNNSIDDGVIEEENKLNIGTYPSGVETNKKAEDDSSEMEMAVYDEKEFKELCLEIPYNKLDKSWIGRAVTKEILFTEKEKDEYICGSTEDYIEEFNDYQHTYRVYNIIDKRYDKSFLIWENDVIRIYGVITDIRTNYANGLDYPIIDMYYIDYVRKWGQTNNDKSIEDIIKERTAEDEKIKKENEYYDTVNSDYTGVTKNIEKMEELSEDEFKAHCDIMNYNNMSFSKENLNGRYVKIKIKLTSTHKKFKNENAKEAALDSLYKLYDINSNVWCARLYSERAENYVGNVVWVYFSDKSEYNWDSLKKNQEITVYGNVFNYKISEGLRNQFDFLVVYME